MFWCQKFDSRLLCKGFHANVWHNPTNCYKICIFFSFKIYETEIKFCYGTDTYGEEVVSNNPKFYDISINLRCWVYSVGRYICTSHPNQKISKKIAICLSEEKMRNAALYPQTTLLQKNFQWKGMPYAMTIHWQ